MYIKETLGESAPAYSTVKKWCLKSEFKRGRLLCERLHHCGRPSAAVNKETAEKVKLFVSGND